MSPKQLEVFVKVAQLGSVTAAANVLGMSQPSVSKSLALVEQQLGFTLFERANGKMLPTAEATQVLEEALRMQEGIARFDRFVEHVRRYRVGQLRICATPALAINVLPAVAAQFKQRYDDVGLVLDMHLNNRIEDAVKEGQYDLGFIVVPDDGTTQPDNVVCRGEMVCVVADKHPLAQHEIVCWEDLDPRELIYITTDTRIISMMNHAIDGFRERPVSALETNRYTMAINLVRRGAGVTLVDEYSLAGTDMTGLAIKRFAPSLPVAVTMVSAGRNVIAEPAAHFIDEMRRLLEAHARA